MRTLSGCFGCVFDVSVAGGGGGIIVVVEEGNEESESLPSFGV